MQPYFFPYLGYWQLLNYVDRFVIYDDVNYIKGGWINRNRILINEEPHFITVPLRGASQNKLICEINIDESAFWRTKMLKSIENAYRKSPFFSEVFPVLEQIIRHEGEDLASFLKQQLQLLAEFLGIGTEVMGSSRIYANNRLSGQDRIIDICRQEHASVYINPEGGLALYSSSEFSLAGLPLQFLKSNSRSYVQRAPSFVSNLSVVDALMAVGREGVNALLTDFTLIKAGP
jgi:hypothetical protein